MGSIVAPTTTNLPFIPSPLISSDMAFELGAVARITCAPPSFCNSSAAFVALLSMYTLAPSFLRTPSFQVHGRSRQPCSQIYSQIGFQGGRGRQRLAPQRDCPATRRYVARR